MSNENKSIHEFDINLIWEYFSNLEQQGPGSPEATTKALSFIGVIIITTVTAKAGPIEQGGVSQPLLLHILIV